VTFTGRWWAARRKKTTLNGQPIQGNLVPVSKMKLENEVLVEMG
jgi:hypothetical protein